MENNNDKTYYLTVRNTLTGKYEKVFVSEEVYRTHTSFRDAEKKRMQRMMRCTVPNENGKPVRCKEDCSKCEALRLGLIEKPTPLSIEGLIEQGFDIPDPNNDFEDRILERRDEEEKERLYKAIGQLTPRQQQLIRLTYYEGLSHDQIAEREGITRRAVSYAVERAENALKRFLKNS